MHMRSRIKFSQRYGRLKFLGSHIVYVVINLKNYCGTPNFSISISDKSQEFTNFSITMTSKVILERSFFQISLKKFKSRKTRWDKIRMTNIFLFVYLVYLFYFNFKNFCYHVKYFLSQIYNCCASKCKLIISNKQFSAASINNQLNISNKYWGCTSTPKI